MVDRVNGRDPCPERRGESEGDVERALRAGRKVDPDVDRADRARLPGPAGDEHRRGRLPDEPLRRAAEEKPTDGAETARADDDEAGPGASRDRDELPVGRPLHGPRPHRDPALP